jgi:hypothetical protein
MDLYHDNTGAQNLQTEKEPSPRDTVEGVVLKSARPARHRVTDSHCILSGFFFFQDWCQCMVLQARSTLFWAMVWLVRCLVWVSYPDPWKTLGLNPDGLRFEGGNIPDVLCKCVLLYSYCYIYIWICRHTQMYIYIYIRIYLYIYYLNDKSRERIPRSRLRPTTASNGQCWTWSLEPTSARRKSYLDGCADVDFNNQPLYLGIELVCVGV